MLCVEVWRASGLGQGPKKGQTPGRLARAVHLEGSWHQAGCLAAAEMWLPLSKEEKGREPACDL